MSDIETLKYQYAQDVALVGEDKAPKRWHVDGFSGWATLRLPPRWDSFSNYRRDPNAPPLPSLDWHEAPEWANWRLDASTGKWWDGKPLDSISNAREPRPPQAWFDVTRTEYESSKGGPASEPADDGVLTGSALLEIANAMETGEAPEAFQYRERQQGKWLSSERWHTLIRVAARDGEIRRKPAQPMTWIEGPGGRFEYPEPMREAPNHLSAYYIPNFADKDGYLNLQWQGGDFGKSLLDSCLCHSSEEAAAAHCRALIAATGGQS